jgi:DNA-binding response OmpR family regulator
VNTLLVMTPRNRGILSAELRQCGAQILEVSHFSQAGRIAETMHLDAVFTDFSLPDGNWRKLLAGMRQLRILAPVIVCVQQADGGWVDLLENGACDLLVEPFATEDVRAVLQRARTILPQRVLRARA